ncbi:hypothetical protein JHK82_037739 [Glycine max]|nr:hypothetical protein JHK82_037739 [Glycine max]
MASDLLSLPYCLSTTQIPPRSHIRHRISTLSNDKFLNRSLQQLNCAESKQDIQLTQNGNRWWEDIGIGSKLNHFARDRYVESFFWSVGMIPEPEFTSCRRELTKAVQLITIHKCR